MTPCVLVIEDNPITRKLVRVALEGEGIRVIEADHKAQAVTAMSKQRPDLVLLDLSLPDADGFELLAQLREVAASPVPPILAFTGLADEKRVLAAGFTDHLLKPVEPSRLVEVVNIHLGRRAHERRGAGRRVLIVDGDAARLRLQRAQLRGLGFKVVAATSTDEALESIERMPPDIVVADILIPGSDGFELCRRLRAGPRTTRVPIVLTSGTPLSHAERELALQAGACAAVLRTTALEQVVAAVELALRAGDAVLMRNSAPPSDSEAEQRNRAIVQLETQASLRSDLKRSERMWAAVSNVLRGLVDLTSGTLRLEQVMASVLSTLLDTTGFPLGAAVTEDKLGVRTVDASIGLSPDHLAALCRRLHVLPTLDSISVEFHGIEADAREYDALLRSIGARSLLLVSLVAHDRHLGLLVLASPNAALPEDALAIARMVAGPIAQAVTLARNVGQLASSEHRFRGIAECTADGIVVSNAAGIVTFVNPAAEQVMGVPAEDLMGKPLGLVAPPLSEVRADRHITVTRPDGVSLPIDAAVRTFEDPPGHVNRVYVLRDLSARLQVEQLAHLANHDALTGLYNRRRFEEDLTIRLEEARRYQRQGALLLFDLDGFKLINDRFGHAAGDLVLKAVGEALRDTMRKSDIRARLGGDEFVLLFADATLEKALACAKRLLEAVAGLAPVYEGNVLRVTASIGVALFPAHGPSVATVLAAADQALYSAKRAGRNRYRLHAPGRDAPTKPELFAAQPEAVPEAGEPT